MGVQPDAAGTSVETRRGYADQLYATLRRSHPGLRLVKLGCPGETTATMMNGGICAYPGGSQLAAAASFLHAHRARVSLVTIDIGANDADGCVTRLSFGNFASCLSKSIPQVTTILTKILTRLRQADPKAHIIAMSYYLPALAQRRTGWLARPLRGSASVIARDNILLNRVYTLYWFGWPTCSAPSTPLTSASRSTVPGFGTLPRNVAAICLWTWECWRDWRGPGRARQPGRADQVIAHALPRARPVLRQQGPGGSRTAPAAASWGGQRRGGSV